MTNKQGRKLAHEILGLTVILALISLVLFFLLSGIASAIAETYCFDHDIPMTEFDWLTLDSWIFRLSMLISVGFFLVLFLALLGDRLSYIRKITDGIHSLRSGQQDLSLPLEGSNELTQLAEAINGLSAAQQEIREKEQALNQEKEQLIRTLSHDIRTPLTSILAYTDYLSSRELSPEEQKSHLHLIQKKAVQIRELTDILLDGGKRNPELFEDARLLMEQLAAEFEESLEDQFAVTLDLSNCRRFEGSFDVQELRRIFDNLCSNIQKYADPGQPVSLVIANDGGTLLLRQTNAVRPKDIPSESYQLGINSIRRIVQHYGGQVVIRHDTKNFEITITLSDF